jgi:hypothetical protein
LCVTNIRSLREQEAVCVRVHIPFCACAFVCSILALLLRRPNRRENVGEWRAAEGGLAFRSLADARDLAAKPPTHPRKTKTSQPAGCERASGAAVAAWRGKRV